MSDLPPGYRLIEGAGSADYSDVHAMLVEAYWCKGTTQERIEKSSAGSSLVLNVFFEERQVGFARVVSDQTTFGWICDVIVHEGHRGKGIARAMVRHALSHPSHQRFRRWVLATADAHGVYSECGFTSLDRPERWMVFLPPDAPERVGAQADVV